MSNTLHDVLMSNLQYSKTLRDKSSPPINSSRKLAILTCVDAFLNPAKFAGLNEVDAYVIHNAGGRASDDAIHSLVVSYDLLGANEWLIVHHTGCRVATIGNPLTDRDSRIDRMVTKDMAHSVVTDVWRTRNHPLVPSGVSIHGYVFDVQTGKLTSVPGAVSPGVEGAAEPQSLHGINQAA